ncbi:hypothetical protein D9756_011373 [Leucocoprinus leucothites]|uniref:Uncharacterized protein n=1 Tax=Leucocoprinus leucothites TaxID=201217 RepID=A0A8H5FQJ5_9AGAR|nr:hypothetical protein D9756_011373 [Leucoagaricus leucothites]
MLFALFPTFLTVPSSDCLACIFAVLLAQALLTTYETLLTVLSLPLHALYWFGLFCSMLVYDTTLGFSLGVQTIFDYVKGGFVDYAFSLLMALHGVQSTGSREYYWSDNISSLSSNGAKLETQKRDNEENKKPVPALPSSTSTVIIKHPGHASLHQQSDVELAHQINPIPTRNPLTISPRITTKTTKPDATCSNAEDYTVIILPSSQHSTTPHIQSILSFTERLRSLVRFTISSQPPGSLPRSPTRSPIKSRLRSISRKFRSRKRTGGLCTSTSGDSLNGLMHNKTGATSPIMVEATERIRGLVLPSDWMPKVGNSTAVVVYRAAKREERYRKLVDKLRKLQSILDCDEY